MSHTPPLTTLLWFDPVGARRRRANVLHRCAPRMKRLCPHQLHTKPHPHRTRIGPRRRFYFRRRGDHIPAASKSVATLHPLGWDVLKTRFREDARIFASLNRTLFHTSAGLVSPSSSIWIPHFEGLFAEELPRCRHVLVTSNPTCASTVQAIVSDTPSLTACHRKNIA